jgi:hypothetical protein
MIFVGQNVAAEIEMMSSLSQSFPIVYVQNSQIRTNACRRRNATLNEESKYKISKTFLNPAGSYQLYRPCRSN